MSIENAPDTYRIRTKNENRKRNERNANAARPRVSLHVCGNNTARHTGAHDLVVMADEKNNTVLAAGRVCSVDTHIAQNKGSSAA